MNIYSFYNFKFLIVCMLLAGSPIVIFSHAVSCFSSQATQKDVSELCQKPGVETVEETRLVDSKVTIHKCDKEAT